MDDVSRRTLLSRASVGAAAAGALAVGGPILGPSGVAAAAPAPEPARPLSDPVVARVRDLATGRVDLFVGDREVTVTDTVLAHHIARAAQS